MEKQKDYQILQTKLADRTWRLNNLYYIKNKQGKIVLLQFNKFQEILCSTFWFLNVILKARQLGISTIIEIYILDTCLFNSNTEAGIIDATLPDAKKKLKIVKLAYSRLPDWLKQRITLIKDNEQELLFSNGSQITADTSFRGATVQVLHISEYGKICKTDPIKANEIKTGALNAVAKGQLIFIESTAEDADGDFYNIVDKAEKLQLSGEELTELDYKFFFFPWFDDEKYCLKKPEKFVLSKESDKYFDSLSKLNINLSEEQKFWYVKKREEQGDDMKKEYPATSKEAFEAITEDKYYKDLMLIAQANNRITEFDYDKGRLVDLDLDLGKDDYLTCIFSQQIGKEIHIIDYFEINQVDPPEVAKEIMERGYTIGTMYLPHDAKQNRFGMPKDVYSQFSAYYRCDIVPMLDIVAGISEVRRIFGRIWFKRSTTLVLRQHLEKYGKKWSEAAGKFVGPNHNEHSHAADALRGLAVRLKETKTDNDIGIKRYTVPINSVTGY